MMIHRRIDIYALMVVLSALSYATPSHLSAQSESTAASQLPVARQSPSDAWWTGPVLTAGAGTLPRGHMLLEPYVYDVRSPNSNSFGSLTYLLYGVANHLTMGVIPKFGFNKVAGGPSSSRVGVGDVGIQTAYQFAQFHEGSWVPTASFVLIETLPTGKYDQLGAHPNDGFGSGAYTTSLGLYTQSSFWMPNGRILRARIDVAQAFSSRVNVRDESVYGTGAGFSGHASPGNSFTATGSVEYSVTKRWVLATDVGYGESGSTLVRGLTGGATNFSASSGTSSSYSFVPAVEFSWTPNVGVIVGVRRILPGRNANASTTPVAAINIFR